MALTPDQLSALISRLVADSALWHTIVHGGAAETVETEGGTRPSIAKALADLAGGLVSAFSASSTSEVVLGTGEKVFTIEAGKLFQPGMPVVARSAGDPTLVMFGDVVSLANTVLTIDVTAGAFAGSAADWTIAFSGPRGPKGIDGDPGGPGLSAYQVAVANGFEGDQAAWLASLHGADGASTFGDITGAPGDNTALAAALDGKQPLHANLTALAALTLTANKLLYLDGTGAPAMSDLSAFARMLLDDGDSATVRATIGAASPADIATAISNLVASSPAALDTLNELAAALGNDPNFATTVTNAIAAKADAAATAAALAAKAPIESPAFSGNPTAPTPADGDNDNSLATTAFVGRAAAKAGARNRLSNGAFSFKTVGLATTPDGCYGINAWYALTQSNPIAFLQTSEPEPNVKNGLRLTQSNASAQRMGLAQVLSYPDTIALRNIPSTFSGRVKTSAGNIMNFAIVEWTGPADAVTLDMVNDWASTNFTLGNFFKTTNLNAPVRSGSATTANTWQSFNLTYTPSSAATNLFLLAWSNGALAQSATLEFNSMQFEPGAATPFALRDEKLLRPLVVVVTGQSNPALYPAYTWNPSRRLRVWNNTRNAADVGTKFEPMDGTVMNVGYSAAAKIAEENPDREVHVIVVSVGGMTISHWLSGTSAPDMYAALKGNIEAALAVLGLDSLSPEVPFYFWDGESDAVNGNTGIGANFETLHARLRDESWWHYEQQIGIFGISSLSGTTYAAYNKYLKAIVAAEPATRFYIPTHILPVAYWDPAGAVPYIHGNAAGFFAAGILAVNSWRGAREGHTRGLSVDPYTGNYMFGPGLAPGSDYFNVMRAEAAETRFTFGNLDAGAGARARLQGSSNAGSIALVAFSTAAGGGGGLYTYGLAQIQYIAPIHRFYNSTPVNNHTIDADGVLQPASDNALSLGLSSKRWTTIYLATNPTVTSDARQKRNIATLDGALCWEFLTRISARTFQWVSGQTIVDVEEDPDNMIEETIMEEVQVEREEIEVVEGRAILRKVPASETRETFDLLPLQDEAGNPVFNANGPAFFKVLRKRRVPGKREVYTTRAGERIHLGMIAQEVKAVMDDLGVDWAVFVHDAESDQMGLRYEQFIPIIIAAVQWKFSQIDAAEWPGGAA